MAFYGMLEDTTDRYTTRSDWAKAPADEAFIHAAIRLRALSAASVPLRVYVRSGHDLTPADLTEDKDAKELQELLDFVNPDTMSSSDLKATLVSSLSIYGEAYLLKTRGRLGGRPKELHFLNPAAVTPKMGDRWIDEYVYQPVGRQQTATYDPKDVIAFRVPGNFIDPTRGLSPINAVRMEIGTSRMATEHTNSQLRNQGVPAGVWVAPKDSEITTQDQSTIKRVLASLRGPKNAGKTAVLPGGLEWRSLGFSEKDAQYLMARKVSRMAIGAALGVPLALLGDDEHTGVYRSTRDAEQVFWRRLTEELNWMAQIIDSWLTSEYDKTGQRLTVRFDTSAVEALRPTIMEQSSLWQMMLSMGIVTTNEARAHFGVGAPVEWGNVPVRSGGLAPIGVDGMPVMPAAPAAPGAPAPDAAQPAEGKEPAVIDAMTPEDESDDPEVQPITPTVSSWQRFGGSSQSGLPKGSKHADHDQADHGNRDGAGGDSGGDDKDRQAAEVFGRPVTNNDRELASVYGLDIAEYALLRKEQEQGEAERKGNAETARLVKEESKAALREAGTRIAFDKDTPVAGGVATVPITRAQAEALSKTLWGQGPGSVSGYSDEFEKAAREAVEKAISNPRGGLVLPSYGAAEAIANSLTSVGQARSDDGGQGAARPFVNLAERIASTLDADPFAAVSGNSGTAWVFDPFDQPSGEGFSVSQLDTPAKFLAIKHGDHDQGDHGNRDGAGGDEIQVDTAQALSPEAAAADLERRLGDSPKVEALREIPKPTLPPEWSSWKPREGGSRVTLTSAQKDLIEQRGLEQSGNPRTWNHVMAQIVEGRRGLDLDGDDVKELLDMVRNEADVHLDRRMGGDSATAGEQRVVASLIAKLESITSTKFLAVKHGDHDQTTHGNRDGATGGDSDSSPSPTAGSRGAAMGYRATAAIESSGGRIASLSFQSNPQDIEALSAQIEEAYGAILGDDEDNPEEFTPEKDERMADGLEHMGQALLLLDTSHSARDEGDLVTIVRDKDGNIAGAASSVIGEHPDGYEVVTLTVLGTNGLVGGAGSALIARLIGEAFENDQGFAVQAAELQAFEFYERLGLGKRENTSATSANFLLTPDQVGEWIAAYVAEEEGA
jgi:HK97 family phage portal protein